MGEYLHQLVHNFRSEKYVLDARELMNLGQENPSKARDGGLPAACFSYRLTEIMMVR
jgi:hypothetical protein